MCITAVRKKPLAHENLDLYWSRSSFLTNGSNGFVGGEIIDSNGYFNLRVDDYLNFISEISGLPDFYE